MKWLCFTIGIIIAGCSTSAIDKKLSTADSLVLNFNAPGSDSIVKTVFTTDKNAIKKLGHFVGNQSTEQYKCGYDGSLIFYSKGQPLLPVTFKYKDQNCRHFLFELDGQLNSTRLSKEAADFLGSLEEGKSWY
jgi:hypothetical protein